MQIDERLKVPENWVNVGDANPERHGGIFVKWDSVCNWHIIETRHYADLPHGLTEKEHMFEHIYPNTDEMWENPKNLKEGFTDWFMKELDSFHNPSVDPRFFENPESELPENETIDEFIDWLLEENAERLVLDFAFAYTGYYGGHTTDFSEDYWGYLENYGIEEENF